MSKLPIRNLLWADNRPGDHFDHIHVDCEPPGVGDPPLTNPGPTPALAVVLGALDARFPDWPSLGIYNRRKIAGSSRWSQHAYANAVDIGKLIGKPLQRPYVDFLQREDHGAMNYRGVLNVPTQGGEVAPYAKNVIDWGIDSGLIVVSDDNPDDWNRPLTDGRYWTFEYRRRNQ